mmetsp:Transcript_39229/g.93752  ORF Transcript_39229/g.93752 Transcript_39229/m.93752 type:complete len:279 (-) Transcript_39229:506-1342(-)
MAKSLAICRGNCDSSGRSFAKCSKSCATDLAISCPCSPWPSKTPASTRSEPKGITKVASWLIQSGKCPFFPARLSAPACSLGSLPASSVCEKGGAASTSGSMWLGCGSSKLSGHRLDVLAPYASCGSRPWAGGLSSTSCWKPASASRYPSEGASDCADSPPSSCARRTWNFSRSKFRDDSLCSARSTLATPPARRFAARADTWSKMSARGITSKGLSESSSSSFCRARNSFSRRSSSICRLVSSICSHSLCFCSNSFSKSSSRLSSRLPFSFSKPGGL